MLTQSLAIPLREGQWDSAQREALEPGWRPSSWAPAREVTVVQGDAGRSHLVFNCKLIPLSPCYLIFFPPG